MNYAVTGGRRRGKGLKLSQGKLGLGFVSERRLMERWDELLGEAGTAQELFGIHEMSEKCPKIHDLRAGGGCAVRPTG